MQQVAGRLGRAGRPLAFSRFIVARECDRREVIISMVNFDDTAPSRRAFLAAAAAAGCACALECPLLREAAGAAAQGEIDVGTPADFTRDGIFETFLASQRILLVREAGRLFALRAICTHRTATLRVRDGEIICKSHGSRFTPEGAVTKGPASRPLFRYAIRINERRRIIVDPSQTFAREKSDDPASFLNLGVQ